MNYTGEMTRVLRTALVFSASVLFSIVPVADLFSQIGGPAPSLTEGLFGGPVPRAETEAELAAWDPVERIGLISVKYTYPEGYQVSSLDQR